MATKGAPHRRLSLEVRPRGWQRFAQQKRVIGLACMTAHDATVYSPSGRTQRRNPRGGGRRSSRAPFGRAGGGGARGLGRYYTHNLDTEEPAAENTPTPASCCLPSGASHPGEETISRRVKKRGRKRGEGARVRDAGQGAAEGRDRRGRTRLGGGSPSDMCVSWRPRQTPVQT